MTASIPLRLLIYKFKADDCSDFINQSHIGHGAPYAISKAGVNALVAKLGAAYEGEGILFISLCPGMVDTTAAQNAAKCTPSLLEN